MTSKEALKRLDQETIPNTYMADFDKKECVKVISGELDLLSSIKEVFNATGITYGVDEYGKYIDISRIRAYLNDKNFELFYNWLKNA